MSESLDEYAARSKENALWRLRQERADLRKAAIRALKLDREPIEPVGGIRTGDRITVGVSDWHRLLRLARRLAK